MKKTIILLSAAALVFAACQKEEGSIASINGLKLTATIEQQDSGSETKTYLDDLKVKWSAGDQVNVFTDASSPEKLTLTLSEGDSTTSGTFTTSETPTGTPQYAIYPAASGNSINGSTITFTLPATQNYVANSFDNGANVAVGKVSNGAIAYKNVCGVLKLNLKGDITVSKIELSGKNSENLYGTFTIDANNITSAGASYLENGGTTLTLNCGDDGVELSLDETTTFYIVVPVGSFGDDTYPGFTAKVYEKGTSNTYDVETNSSNVIIRSRIKAMPNCWLVDGNVYMWPSTYQEVEYLQSTGVQYIDTEIYPNDKTLGAIFEWKSTLSLSDAQGADNWSGEDNYSSGNVACYQWGVYKAKLYYILSNSSRKALLVKTFQFDSDWHEVIFNKYGEGTKIDGVSCISETYNTVDSYMTLYLFARHGAGSINPVDYSKQAYKYCFFYDGDTPLAMFIPCYRISDSKPGMYDLVTSTFFVNQGTGADFTTGPAVTY